MSGAVTYTSREEIDVHRFSWGISIGIPLLAIFLQIFLPVRLGFLAIFDLPLLVTIFFAVARRKPITGLLTGALIGTVQDAFTSQPIGLNGIAKTMIGYLASSLGVRLDVENPGSRFLMTFAFYLAHRFIYMIIDMGLVGTNEPQNWGHLLFCAVCNGTLAIPLFMLLDRFKLRS
ncbi:MAG TPA: rod shape-determining protein MreD [Candidatus Angelobacter sp.]|jgi:rod shape-determining protein MreD|nr:rod shape-determining protein MreD [Candidatus Angelobacter sp.]